MRVSHWICTDEGQSQLTRGHVRNSGHFRRAQAKRSGIWEFKGHGALAIEWRNPFTSSK
jgi:hypothetical protein